MAAQDIHSLILSEVDKIPGQKKQAKNRLMIVCPFHDDRTPSCGIVMAEDGRYELGSFNCLGCGEHGNWNKLAEKLGLQTIGKFMPKGGTAVTFGLKAKINELQSEMMSGRERDLEEMLDFLGAPATQPWPIYSEWRGYPGWLIKNIGGIMAVGGRKLSRGDVFCYLPVVVRKKIVGFVRAFLDKKPGRESYLTSEGEWVKQSGLFPYEYTRLMINKLKRKRFVVLVEGPRDALRLIMSGIPALAILGTQNMSRSKLKELQFLGLDYVFLLPDNDKAGRDLKEKVKWHMDNFDFDFEVKFLKLPREKDEDGKVIKMDPDCMPSEILKNLKELLVDKYDCKGMKKCDVKDIVFKY